MHEGGGELEGIITQLSVLLQSQVRGWKREEVEMGEAYMTDGVGLSLEGSILKFFAKRLPQYHCIFNPLSSRN